MYTQCKEYLIEKLHQAGIKTKIITSLKILKRAEESHIGAVLYGDEVLLRNGSKRIIANEGGRKKRRKIFDRNLTFSVFIGGYSTEDSEKIYEAFLGLLDQGIVINGNFVSIEPEMTQWIDEEDSILKAKVGIQLKLTFYGGIYKDTGYAPLYRAMFDAQVERKEDVDGKNSEGSGAAAGHQGTDGEREDTERGV